MGRPREQPTAHGSRVLEGKKALCALRRGQLPVDLPWADWINRCLGGALGVTRSVLRSYRELPQVDSHTFGRDGRVVRKLGWRFWAARSPGSASDLGRPPHRSLRRRQPQAITSASAARLRRDAGIPRGARIARVVSYDFRRFPMAHPDAIPPPAARAAAKATIE